MECTLCQSSDLKLIRSHVVVNSEGQCFHCQNCDLIFKNPADYWSWEKQKHRYDQHNNNLEEPGYVQYFEQLLKPLDSYLREFSIKHGLDWGSGPEPVLQELMKRRGVKMDIFDPIYHNFEEVLEQSYPLLTCTEVIEHFMEPRKSLVKMQGFLGEGGVFAGMTQFHLGPEHFANWWYAKDPTHVSFYSEKTFHWLSEFLGLKILSLHSPIFILQR